MNTQVSVESPKVFFSNDRLVTTSQAVADYFDKQHKDVLRKIDTLECSPEFASAHFCAHVENQLVGVAEREIRYFEITKDGFMFLVMGFTGKRAARLKEAYIAKFNSMEAELIAHQPPAIIPMFPPTGQRYSYTVDVETDGTVTAIELIKPGYVLIHPSDSVEMLRRKGYVICHHKELRSTQIDHIGRMCDESAKMEAEWILANRRSHYRVTSR